MFVAYVSKTAMFETFRITNRVNVECINDLVISFYDIKREKKLLAKHKKKDFKDNQSQASVSSTVVNSVPPKSFDFRYLLGAGGAICLGVMLVKIFS